MILHLGHLYRLAKVKGDGGVALPLGGAHLDDCKEGFYKTIEEQSESDQTHRVQVPVNALVCSKLAFLGGGHGHRGRDQDAPVRASWIP